MKKLSISLALLLSFGAVGQMFAGINVAKEAANNGGEQKLVKDEPAQAAAQEQGKAIKGWDTVVLIVLSIVYILNNWDAVVSCVISKINHSPDRQKHIEKLEAEFADARRELQSLADK